MNHRFVLLLAALAALLQNGNVLSVVPPTTGILSVLYNIGEAMLQIGAKRLVLTTAHCTGGPGRNWEGVPLAEFRVYAGDYMRGGMHEQQYRVLKVVRHPLYHGWWCRRRDFFMHDVALLILDRPIDCRMGSMATILRLPINNQFDNINVRSCAVAGWGSTNDIGDNYSLLMRSAPMSLVDIRHCFIETEGCVDSSTDLLCATDDRTYNRDSCGGDSGGPLMCRRRDDGAWTLVGLVSVGEPCNSNHRRTAGFYTDISVAIPWLFATFKRLNFYDQITEDYISCAL